MRKNHDKFDEILNKVEWQDVKLDFKINDTRVRVKFSKQSDAPTIEDLLAKIANSKRI